LAFGQAFFILIFIINKRYLIKFMSEFKFPTEMVELPSKGLLYPESNPLSSGKIEMKYMTAREEDILTNSNYIKQGIVIDKLLQSMIVTKINYQDLLVCDKDAILVAARILGYGKDYQIRYPNPQTGEYEDVIVDLTQLKEKPLDESLLLTPKTNEFSFKLPNTDNEITFKLLNQVDENNIDQELKGLKKLDPNSNPELTTRLKFIILSVNGNYEKKTVREFVDNALLARDSRALREYINKITPGTEMKYSHVFLNGVEEDINVPIGVDFFWPES
jgi:hypothetical protein